MAYNPVASVLCAAATYDLTTLADVKDELKLTGSSDDVTLARMISGISATIANYCNVVFPVETVQDVFYPDRLALLYDVGNKMSPLVPSRSQVIRNPLSYSISAGAAVGATVFYISSLSDTTTLIGMPMVGDSFPDGAYVVSASQGAHSITISSGCIVAIASGGVVSFGPRVTVTDTSGASVGLVIGTDYEIDPGNGFLIRLNSTTGLTRQWAKYVTKFCYQSGYATIPLDLADAAIQLVVGRYRSRGRDPAIRTQDSPGIGPVTYWVGSPGGGIFPDDIMGILDNYRMAVV